MSNIKKYMQLKTQEEKNNIERQLLSKTLSIENFTLENLIDLIGVAKTNLNNEIKDFVNLKNEDYNNNLKTTIRLAGFSDSNVQQLFLSGLGILRPRTKKLLTESELFTELELKLIEASANKIKKDSDAARAEKIAKVLEKRKNKQTDYQEQKQKAAEKVEAVNQKEEPIVKYKESLPRYNAIIFTENMSKIKKIMFAVKSILNNNYEEVQRVRN